MSATIDERVVEMQFNNKQFEQNAKESIKTLDKLNSSLDLKGSTEGFDALQKSIKSIDLSNINNSMDAVTNKISVIGTIGDQVLRNLTNKAIDFGTKWVKSLTIDQIGSGWKKYEAKTEAVQTIMHATGLSIDKVNESLDKLNHYTDETSYRFDDMVSTISKFTNAGIKDLDKAEMAVEGIANWAATAGVGASAASRAFINLSQAMSDSLKVQDWISIEGLNMNTVEFMQTAIDTAQAMIDSGEASEDMAAAFRKAKPDVIGFRNTLSTGWLNKEVMIEVFKKYADQTTDFGLKAYKAAQEAKTFKDVIESIKEAVATDWSKLFEQLFGNYEEARVFWTNVANELIEVFTAPTSALVDLMTEWHELGGYEMFIESLTNAWEGLKSVVSEVSDIFSEFFPALKVDTLVSFTEKIRDLTKAFRDSVTKKTIEDIVPDLDNIPDFDKLNIYNQLNELDAKNKKVDDTLSSLKDTVTGIFSVIKLVKTVLQSLYKLAVPFIRLLGPIGRLVSTISAGLGRMATKMIDTILKSEKLNKVFEYMQRAVNGVTRIIGLLIDDFADFIANVKELPAVKQFTQLLDNMWQNFKKIASPYIQKAKKNIEKFLDSLEGVETKDIYGFINKMAEYMVGFVQKTIEIGKSIGQYLKPKLQAFWNFLSPCFSWLGSQLTGIFDWIKAFVRTKEFQTLKNDISKVLGDISGKLSELVSELIDFIQEGGLSGALEFVRQKLTDLWNTLKGMDWSGVISKVFEGGKVASILLVALTVYRASKMFKAASSFFSSFSSGFLAPLKAFAKGLGLQRFATSVLMLAGALYVLSKVPIEDIWELFGAITALGAVLVIFTTAYEVAIGSLAKVGMIDKKAILTTSLAMITMAASMWILAKAAKAMSDIPAEKLGEVLGTLVSLMGVVVVAVFAVGFMGTSIKALGIGLLATAAAVLLLILAFEKIRSYMETLKDAADDGVIVKSAGILLALIGTLGLISFVLKKVSSAAWQTAAVIFATGAAVFFIAAAAERLLQLNNEQLWQLSKVLFSLIATMTLLAAVSRLFPADGGKKLLGMGGALIGLGAAVYLITIAIQKLGEMDANTVRKGLKTLWEIMIQIGVVMAATSFAKGTFGGFMGLALMLIAVIRVLKYLSEQNYGEFMRASTLLGAILIKLGISLKLGEKAITGAKFGGMIGIVLMVATVAAALGLLASFCKTEDLIGASVAFGGAMLALGRALKNMSKVASDKIPWGMILTTVIMTVVVAAALGILAQQPWGSLLAAAGAMALVMEALSDSMNKIAAASIFTGSAGKGGFKKILPMLTLMAGTMLAVAVPLGRLAKLPVNGLLGASVSMTILIGALTGMMAALSKMKFNMKPRQIGKVLLAMAGVVAIVGVALWAMSKAVGDVDPSSLLAIASSMSALTLALAAITAAMGLLGKIGFKSSLEGFGAFATITAGLILLFAGIWALDKYVANGKILDIINRAGEVLGAIGSAIGNLVGGFLGGMSSGLSEIGANITSFISAIRPGLEEFKEINIDPGAAGALESIAGAILKLTGASILEGLTSWLAKKPDISTFAKNISDLGPACKTFATEMSGVDTSGVDAGIDIIEKISNVARKMQRVGGIVQDVLGTPKDLGTFAAELGSMVTGENGAKGGLMEFAEKAPEIAKYKDSIDSVTDVIESLANIANSLNPSLSLKIGSWLEASSEAGNLKQFASQLPDVGTYISEFATNIQNLPDNFGGEKGKAAQVAESIAALAEIGNSLQPTDRSYAWGAYKEHIPSLKEFLDGLATVGPSLKGVDEAFNDDLIGKIKTIGTTFSQFAIDISGLNDLTRTAIGEDVLSLFIASLFYAGDQAKRTIDKWDGLDFSSIFDGINQLSLLAVAKTDFEVLGTLAVEAMLNAMQATIEAKVATNVSERLVSELETCIDPMYQVGQQVAEGFVRGILSKVPNAARAGKTLGDAAVLSAKASVEVNSPSRVMMRIGSYVGEGFVDGIAKWFSVAGEVGQSLAESTVDAASLALDYVHELMSGDMDVDMTIRPVMDLTDVNAGMNTISSLFSQRQALMAQLDTAAVDNSSDIDELLDVGWKILKEIQNGSDLYLDDKVLAGRINRRLGQA